MLEIFALCSCACLACLWCAVFLEMTKGRCCSKGLDEIFSWNCTKCSKDHRCTDQKGQTSSKLCCKDVRLKKFNRKERKIPQARDFEETRKKDEGRSCRCCRRLLPAKTSCNQPCSRSQSFPRLRPSHTAITTCKRACKICHRVKHGCACTKDNDLMHELPTSWIHHHPDRSSCPNLISQDQCCCYYRSPVRYFYHSLAYDPYERSIDRNICIDHREFNRQGRAIARRKNRFFARMKKERRL